MKNNQEIEKNEVVSINYAQPKFWHRVMANFIDFFLLLVMTLVLFIAARSIVLSTPHYQQVEQKISSIQLECGLYVKDENENKNVDIVYYLNKADGLYGGEFDGVGEIDAEGNPTEPQYKIGKIVHAINTFIAYCGQDGVVPVDRYNELLNYYDSMRLEAITDTGVHYFVKDGDKIVPNETLSSVAENRKLYYKNVYTPIIEDRMLPFLTSNVTEYREAFRVEFNYLVFLEIPVSYSLAAILVYYVPPLFIKRGRKTLGKAIYHIGLIDDRVLSPSFGRFTARFAILLFSEFLLSLVTYLVILSAATGTVSSATSLLNDNVPPSTLKA